MFYGIFWGSALLRTYTRRIQESKDLVKACGKYLQMSKTSIPTFCDPMQNNT